MLATLLREYQDMDPITGRHDCPRTLRQYAELLGVGHTVLVHIFGGKRTPGGKVIRGLLRAFPNHATEISAAIAATEPEPAEVVA